MAYRSINLAVAGSCLLGVAEKKEKEACDRCCGAHGRDHRLQPSRSEEHLDQQHQYGDTACCCGERPKGKGMRYYSLLRRFDVAAFSEIAVDVIKLLVSIDG